MGSHSGKARKFINRSEYVVVYEFLKTILTTSVVDGDRIAIYTKPWTDEAVVKEMREQVPHLNQFHVARLRQEVFGKLPRALNNPLGRPSPRVAALELRLAALEAWARTMDDTFAS